jgi:anti-sigma factor RsiW
MRCEEVQSLQGPYLDSELDARASLEIEQHLKSCPECARLFTAEQKREERLKAGLNRGSRTPALWEQIERSVVSAAPSATRSGPPTGVLQLAGWLALISALGEQFQARLRRSPRAWAGLAVMWVVILVLNFTAREPDDRLVAGQRVPSLTELRFAWKQKQILMADLAFAIEPAPADRAKPAPPSPHSDRQKETLNT